MTCSTRNGVRMRTAEIINVDIGRNADGWYVATSDDMPGLYVAHPDVQTVIDDIPATIEALHLADHGARVRAIKGAYKSAVSGLPWIMLPPATQNVVQQDV